MIGEEPLAAPRYGRGTFTASPAYVRYMSAVVQDVVYQGMPGAVDANGRVRWQVSSGVSTSFHEYYERRWNWWKEKADKLGLRGTGNQDERFTITARVIHPTGYRPCRLCGELRNVGYFYATAALAARIEKVIGTPVEKWSTVAQIIDLITNATGPSVVDQLLSPLFPEREEAFLKVGLTEAAFELTRHLRSRWLSPGYMANPPDRLDGFHDYCVFCRAANDPGRGEANMRTYRHDRRAFEQWAEGDWSLADTVYNLAGQGICHYCGRAVDKVSPDHIGPLSCGFKQMPLFVPSCNSCNSSRNRRMRLADVRRLIAYETASGMSVASWQIRGYWDINKNLITTDREAATFSTSLRAIQDCYLRTLHALWKAGHGSFLASLLHPEYAFNDHEFVGLDGGTLEYVSVITRRRNSRARRSLANRSVRIAFDALEAYVAKQASARRLPASFRLTCQGILVEAQEAAAAYGATDLDNAWNDAVAQRQSDNELTAISELIRIDGNKASRKNIALKAFITGRLGRG